MLRHGENLLTSQSRVPLNGRLIDTWGGGHMYLLILDLLQLFFCCCGGCHDLLLGCDINSLRSWSNQGSTLVALECPCINRVTELK
jgi:hypothetical protein